MPASDGFRGIIEGVKKQFVIRLTTLAFSLFLLFIPFLAVMYQANLRLPFFGRTMDVWVYDGLISLDFFTKESSFMGSLEIKWAMRSFDNFFRMFQFGWETGSLYVGIPAWLLLPVSFCGFFVVSKTRKRG